MVPAATGPPPDTAATSSVLAGLPALDVLAHRERLGRARPTTPSSSPPARFTGDDAAERNATLVELVTALDAAGSGAVVAGDARRPRENGLVGASGPTPTLSAAVSTVDNVGAPAGRISTVLALRPEGEGTSGKYGTGEDTQPVPPVPAADAVTPRPSARTRAGARARRRRGRGGRRSPAAAALAAPDRRPRRGGAPTTPAAR